MEFSTQVKLAIYETIAETATVPSTFDVAAKLGAPLTEVVAAFGELHKKRLLVPEPGDPSRIRMAPPFSGVPTSFEVIMGDKRYFANCIWDALGVPAALHAKCVVHACDGQTGEPITFNVSADGPEPEPCVAHFAVPAAHWWDDIIFT
jgi:hypothetical protein